MKLTDLLKSNFKHFRFICSYDDFEEDTIIEWWENLGKGIQGMNHIHFKKFFNDIGENYDLGACLNYGMSMKINAYVIAKKLEQSKLFVFSYLEYDAERETLFIHLKRK